MTVHHLPVRRPEDDPATLAEHLTRAPDDDAAVRFALAWLWTAAEDAADDETAGREMRALVSDFARHWNATHALPVAASPGPRLEAVAEAAEAGVAHRLGYVVVERTWQGSEIPLSNDWHPTLLEAQAEAEVHRRTLATYRPGSVVVVALVSEVDA
ncbi:hypothetical protein IGS67_08560 [Flavimobilis sp. GY10621]|uniref:Uncharacterized protein n=1 Tax=Flavimobilis rhizosphaerae TaxID=2775421 RepID=A0ABR9DQZ9_9MICO|nr:hypothetical protein [Flavimobilis rhizosphaerae]MBD9699541.1 hypothetical protein [Flavimobilis rhizosphaerae]